MRVTEAMIYQQTVERANAALAKVAKAQGEVSSGLRRVRPTSSTPPTPHWGL